MSWQTRFGIGARERRRRLVIHLRNEGRDAFLAGKSRQECPYKDTDRFQWLAGFDQARLDALLDGPNRT